MPIAMHYVTTLCDKYFLNYYGFSAFVMGSARYWVLKHCVKLWPKEHCAYVPSHFHGFEPHLLLCVSQNCNFLWTNYQRGLATSAIELSRPQSHMPTQAITMHFSQSKSTNVTIFAWNCNFLGTISKPVVLDLAQLNMHHSSHFNALFPVKMPKCEILAVSWTPPDKKLKKPSICTGKKCSQRLANLHIQGFWVCQLQCTMLQLCVTSTFWVINGFSAFVMGRSRYRVLKHCVGVKCDPRRTAAYVPSHFHGFEPHLLLCVSWNCDFSWTTYCRDLQQVPLDLACLKP